MDSGGSITLAVSCRTTIVRRHVDATGGVPEALYSDVGCSERTSDTREMTCPRVWTRRSSPRLRGVMKLGFLLLSAVLCGCSTDFHAKSCKTDDDCGAGLVCLAQATGSTCADALSAPLRFGMS